jgi:hypothetical protein
MKIIGIVESDDYSGAAIVDSGYISIVQTNDCWIAASRCMFSHMPVTCEISGDDAKRFVENGVKCFNLDDEITPPKKTTKIKKPRK